MYVYYMCQLELFLSSGTVCLSVYSLVAAIFGMNIPYTWKTEHGFVFKWVSIVHLEYQTKTRPQNLNQGNSPRSLQKQLITWIISHLLWNFWTLGGHRHQYSLCIPFLNNCLLRSAQRSCRVLIRIKISLEGGMQSIFSRSWEEIYTPSNLWCIAFIIMFYIKIGWWVLKSNIVIEIWTRVGGYHHVGFF